MWRGKGWEGRVRWSTNGCGQVEMQRDVELCGMGHGARQGRMRRWSRVEVGWVWAWRVWWLWMGARTMGLAAETRERH